MRQRAVQPSPLEGARILPFPAPTPRGAWARRYAPTLLAIALGAVIRIGWAVSTDFPRLDGGLFYLMIRDLQLNGFRLPAFASYDGGQIPFAYPPLAFYEVGFLSSITGIPVLDFLWLQPAIVCALAVAAFAWLAHSVTSEPRVAWLSTAAFASLPGTYAWQAAGGGLTRSLGCLFAMLLLATLARYYQTYRVRYLAGAMLAGGLLLLSHTDWSLFGAHGSLALLLTLGRTRRATVASMAAGLASVLVAAVWWVPVVQQHGFEVFGAVLDGSTQVFVPGGVVVRLFIPIWGGELFPVFSAFAVFGIYHSLRRREYFAPLVLAAVFTIQIRGEHQMSAVPVALLAGLGMAEAWRRFEASRGAMSVGVLSRMPTSVLFTGFVLVGAFLGVQAPVVAGLAAALSAPQRQAMEWARESTPPESTFLVMHAQAWEPGLEWFPALSERRSVTTVPGYEWVAGAYYPRWLANREAGRCLKQDADSAQCIEEWFVRWRRPDYVFVFKEVPRPSLREDCCAVLAEELRGRSGYTPVYENDEVVIFDLRGLEASGGLMSDRLLPD
ncbi:MAG: hypothetical protein IT299_07475 [Dehalococcoidia bacterium]|nr:hypothetical protein [Dehalococcoidia bacterium]